MLRIFEYNSPELESFLQRGGEKNAAVEENVKAIISEVKKRGDNALYDYTLKFDGVDLAKDGLTVTEDEIADAYKKVSPELLKSFRRAVANIKAYQDRMYKIIADGQGLKNGTGYTIRPVQRAGIYAPGGKAPYPSSVMMSAVTAKCAKVSEVIMVTPVGLGLNPLILVAAKECGVDKIIKIGGAQAIAALAYGTDTVPKCDVITGPGNIYVATAKKFVYGDVGIDTVAGPSEILIIADSTAKPEFTAADMLGQAEHDELASAFLVTTDKKLAEKTVKEVYCQLEKLPKKAIAEKAVADNSAVIIVDNIKEAATVSNLIAPEHLEICLSGSSVQEILPQIINAGAIFLGNYTPEPVGDYYAGPNHVLPTGRAVRFSSALSVDNFIKKISLIEYTEEDLRKAKDDITVFAEAENFFAHSNAVKIRFK